MRRSELSTLPLERLEVKRADMELEDDLSLFIAVVDHESIVAAADQFGIPRSTASKRISRMEKRLGVRLLNRHSRAISLTPSGEIYYSRGREALQSLAKAHHEVGVMAKHPSGTLRISCAEMIGQHVIMEQTKRFLQKFPNVRVEMSLSDQIEDIVSLGYDMAIRLGEQPNSSLITRKLFSAGRMICASSEYLEKHGEPATPEDLTRHSCVTMLTLGSRVNEWSFMVDGDIRKVLVKGQFATNSGVSNYQAILQGLGIGRITDLPNLEAFKTGQVVRLLREYEVPLEAPVVALMPSNRYANPALKLLTEHFARALRK